MLQCITGDPKQRHKLAWNNRNHTHISTCRLCVVVQLTPYTSNRSIFLLWISAPKGPAILKCKTGWLMSEALTISPATHAGLAHGVANLVRIAMSTAMFLWPSNVHSSPTRNKLTGNCRDVKNEKAISTDQAHCAALLEVPLNKNLVMQRCLLAPL